jgi:hypothetical protein
MQKCNVESEQEDEYTIMGIATRLLTTSRQEIRRLPKIKAFLDRKSRNSQNTADSYLLALALVQEFLNTKYLHGHGKKPISVNDFASIFFAYNKKKKAADVYQFLVALYSKVRSGAITLILNI